MTATVRAPKDIPAQTRFEVSGTGYKPKEKLVVQLVHDAPWKRRRDAQVDDGGGFSLHSFSHTPGTIEVHVGRPGKDAEILASTKIKVTAASEVDKD